MEHLEIYQLLKYRRQELHSRMQSIRNDFNDADDLDDVLFKIAHETKLELAKVKHALEDIEQGHYGICQNCGKPISERSLVHDPLCILCDDCKSLG